MKLRKVLACVTMCFMVLPLTGCGTSQATETKENEEAAEVTLNVFAAASMTETLTEIQEMYKEVAPNVTLVFNFDVFISAAQKQMNQLDKDADPEVNTEGLDYVLEGTRINLLENKVVLAVSDGNPKGIESFADLGTDKLSLLALGNEDVPVGQYSEEILTNLGILDQLEQENKITYGSNVKEVTTQVSEAAADAGIIYATDAYSAGLSVVAQADDTMCKQVIYPAAVLNISENQDAAEAFLDYLKTDDCMKVFEEVGFTAVK